MGRFGHKRRSQTPTTTMKTGGIIKSTATDFILIGVPSHFTQNDPLSKFENFGNFENDGSPLKRIYINDVILDADLFTTKLSQLNTQELEQIELNNVSYTKKFNPVFLPALRTFIFKSKTFHEEDFETTSIFFFQKIQNESWRRSEIASLGIDIMVTIEQTLIFKINHAEKYLFILQEATQAQEIIKNCKMSIEHLALHAMSNPYQENFEPLDLNIIPPNLKSLELHFHETDWNKTQNFLAEFPFLEELIYKPRKYYGECVQIVLGKLPPRLKKLCLFKCTVSIDPNFSGSVETLDVLTLYDSVVTGAMLNFGAKIVNILRNCRWDTSSENLDVILRSTEAKLVFVDERATDQAESHPHDSHLPVMILTNWGLMMQNQEGNLKFPEHGFVFWRDQGTEDWKARRAFLEERDYLIQKFSGVPIGGGGCCVSSDFEHELMGDESAFFCISPRPAQRGTSYAPPPLLFTLPLIPHPLLIKYLHLEEIKIFNDLYTPLAQLELLELITIKKCLCSTVNDSLKGPWDPEITPRISDGFALSHLEGIKNLKGLSVVETKLGSIRDSSPVVRALDFLMVDVGSNPEKDETGSIFNMSSFDAKQVVILGRTTSSDEMKGILNMPSVEFILIGKNERRSNSSTVENFLRNTGLECWESGFLLQKFPEDGAAHEQWKGQYVRKPYEYGEMAAKFKFLKTEYDFFASSVKTFDNAEEYLHDRNRNAETVEFRLPTERADPDKKQQHDDPFRNRWRGEAEQKPKESFDPVSNSLKHEGIYVQPSVSDSHGYGINFTTFEGFSESVFQQPIKVLKFHQTKILPAYWLDSIYKLNTSIITELHISECIIPKVLPQLDLKNLKVIDLAPTNIPFVETIIKNDSNLGNFLCRFVPVGAGNPDLSTILSWKIDRISFQVSRKKYLDIDNTTGKVHLAKLPFLSKVLDPEVKVRSLVLDSLGDLDLSKVNKTSLEVLSIQDDGVLDWEEVEAAIKGMTNLSEFYFYRKPFGKKMQIRLDGIPSSVKYLGLSQVGFSAFEPTQPMLLEHLALLEVSFPPNIFGSFPKFFNSKRLVFRVPNSWTYGRSPVHIPNLDFLHAVVTFCRTEWLFLSAFEENGSADLAPNMREFLRNALVPKQESDEDRFFCATPLILEKRNNRWRNCEIEEGSQGNTKFMNQSAVFEDFYLGRDCDENRFRNKIIYFDGFGENVEKVRSIDILGAVVDTDLLRSELKRVGTAAVETISFRDVRFLGPVLEVGEIPFPNLKSFKAQNCSFLGRYDHSEPCWSTVKLGIWFRKSSEPVGEIGLRDLWTLGVHVKLPGLEVDPVEKKVVTNLDDGNSLIVNADGIKSLTFESYSVAPVTIPLTLTYLELDSPMSWKELTNRLANHPNLAELHFGTKGYATGNLKTAAIGHLPPNLKVLQVYNATVTICTGADACACPPLNSLTFTHCNFPDTNFSEEFCKIFGVEEIFPVESPAAAEECSINCKVFKSKSLT